MALEKVTYYDAIGKINRNFEELEALGLTPAGAITNFSGTTNLPATPATFADLAAARAHIEALRAGAETRLDNIEAKMNLVLAALRTTGVISQ